MPEHREKQKHLTFEVGDLSLSWHFEIDLTCFSAVIWFFQTYTS